MTEHSDISCRALNAAVYFYVTCHSTTAYITLCMLWY